MSAAPRPRETVQRRGARGAEREARDAGFRERGWNIGLLRNARERHEKRSAHRDANGDLFFPRHAQLNVDADGLTNVQWYARANVLSELRLGNLQIVVADG